MSKSIVLRYWDDYGGHKALLSSPYFWTSFALSLILFPHWAYNEWWEDTLSIMPNVLGFSLGGYAILLAFGDKNFQFLLSQKDTEDRTSISTDISSAFVHFIVLQILSIFFALACKAFYFQPSENNIIVNFLGEYLFYLTLLFYWFSYFIFIYAVMSAFAATFAIYSMTNWYQNFLQAASSTPKKCECEKKN